jgi:hypothetical protein
MTCYLHPEMPGKPAPCVIRSYGSCCSTGNRKCKTAGLVPQQQHHRTDLPEACAGNQTPELLLLSKQQSHRTAPSEDPMGNQVPKFLPEGFALLCQLQLLWLLEAQAPIQIDPMDSTALWESDDSS